MEIGLCEILFNYSNKYNRSLVTILRVLILNICKVLHDISFK